MNIHFLHNKTVLITGATGLIGSQLVQCLIQANDIRIIAIGRSLQKLESTFEKWKNNTNLVLIPHDLSWGLPELPHYIDYIFHAAGPMESDVIRNSPVDVILPNINGTINCLEYLKREHIERAHKGKMVVFSSVTIYNNPTESDIEVIETNTNYAENLNSISAPYSESKRMSEVIALAYHKQYDIDVVFARFSTVYGYTSNVPNTAFFEFIKKAISGEDIVLNSSSSFKRDNVYLYDAIAGLLKITELGLSGEAYNISSNGDKENFAAIDEIAQTIANTVNECYESHSIKVLYKNKTEQRNPGIKLNNEKLKNLGWNTKTSLADGVKQTIEHFTHLA